MPRRGHSYTQTVIGDCGHVCEAWPQIGNTLNRAKKGTVEVICDICTREKYGIPDEERITVWVKVKDTDPDPWSMKDAPKPPPRKRATKTAPKKPSIWKELMMELPNGEA